MAPVTDAANKTVGWLYEAKKLGEARAVQDLLQLCLAIMSLVDAGEIPVGGVLDCYTVLSWNNFSSFPKSTFICDLLWNLKFCTYCLILSINRCEMNACNNTYWAIHYQRWTPLSAHFALWCRPVIDAKSDSIPYRPSAWLMKISMG